jgi:hypothetical protein
MEARNDEAVNSGFSGAFGSVRLPERPGLEMELFDIVFIIATLIFPMLILLLWKRTYLAYPVSVLAFWLLLIAHPASYLFDPEADNHLGFTMSLLFGWIPGLIYCGFLAALAPKLRSLTTGKNNKKRTKS